MTDTQRPTLTVIQGSPDVATSSIEGNENTSIHDPLGLALFVASRLDDLPCDKFGDLRGEFLAISQNPGKWTVFLNNLLAILRDTQPSDNTRRPA